MLNNVNNIILVFIIINILLFIYKNSFYKLHYYYNLFFKNFITIDCYTNSNNNDYFILSKNCSRPINDYKSMLNCALQLFADVYSDSINKEFKFLILFIEVDPKTNLPNVLLSDPYIFNYNVNDPISVNELFNIIKWIDIAFKSKILKDIAVMVINVTDVTNKIY
jgi:hypothetical protein